jgi:hypothetical protein
MTHSVREIRKLLFDCDKKAYIVNKEMTNKEARDFLYWIEDQDMALNVIDCETHLVIY